MQPLADSDENAGRPSEATPGAGPGRSRIRWRVGTLGYTTMGLAVLSCLLLLGDFAWQLRERSALPMVQLLLRRFHATDFQTGIFLVTLPNLMLLLVCPAISYMSDRYRSRMGRRIPFLLITTPVVVGAITGLAFGPEVGAWLRNLLHQPPEHYYPTVVLVVGLFWTVFEFGALTANAIFGALINDVVPRPMLGRFFGLFRAVGLAAGVLFNYQIIGYSEQHFRAIFLGIGAVYGIGMLVMCFGVREGQYPPPPQTEGGTKVAGAAVRRYLRECFTRPYYLNAFAFFAVGNLSFVPVNTYMLFEARGYGMSMKAYGRIFVVMFICSFILSYPLGWLADRYHPLRVGNAAAAGYSVATIAGFLVVRDAHTFSIALLAHGILSGCFFTGTAPICQVLFPKIRFAQFAAAATMVNALLQIILGPVLGSYLDFIGSDYRYVFLAGSLLSLVTLQSGIMLLRRRAEFPNE